MKKIFPFMLIILCLLTQSCSAEGEKLPGKIVFTSDRVDGRIGTCTLINGKVQKIYHKGGNPHWSLGGEDLLIVRGDKEFRGFVVISPNGKNEIRYPTTSNLYLVAWLPGRNSIVFGSAPSREEIIDNKPFTSNLFLYHLKTKAIVQLTNLNDNREISALAVSPDGKKMVFCRKPFDLSVASEKWEFYIANTDGSDLQMLNIEPLDPSWSHDGKKIVYTTGVFESKKVGHGVMCIYDFETKKERLILDFEKGRGGDSPVFSPDGKQILFSGGSGLYVVNIDGTGLRTVLPPKDLETFQSHDTSPDWTS